MEVLFVEPPFPGGASTLLTDFLKGYMILTMGKYFS
jgi:hypothetical protein